MPTESHFRKGILLAGGSGSRLYPLTRATSKQLLPVYDKPMVYYPLTVLIEAGIRELCLISTPADLPLFRNLLGDGSRFGVQVDYREQPRPEGIAQAFRIADSFIGTSPVALILGDNLFLESTPFQQAVREFQDGATVFGHSVPDPERYGVVELDDFGRPVSLEEKPRFPRSALAVPGMYLYESSVVSVAWRLLPGERGELEITDVNREFLRQGRLRVWRLPADSVCLDAGTSTSLHQASVAVRDAEGRRGVRIGCPEAAAFGQGWLSRDTLAGLVGEMPSCEYRGHLERLLLAASCQ